MGQSRFLVKIASIVTCNLEPDWQFSCVVCQYLTTRYEEWLANKVLSLIKNASVLQLYKLIMEKLYIKANFKKVYLGVPWWPSGLGRYSTAGEVCGLNLGDDWNFSTQAWYSFFHNLAFINHYHHSRSMKRNAADLKQWPNLQYS